MRKILIGVLIILLIALSYLVIFKGLSIGKLNILSVEQISEENSKLTTEIAEVESLMNNDYKARTNELNASVSSLLESKKAYDDLASVSTESEIQAASEEPEYTVEFLLTRLGRHTTAQKVNLEYKILSGNSSDPDMKNISFTVNGTYSRIINFIRVIEDDDTLSFRIQNFKLIPAEENLTATFIVTNVKVKQETLTSRWRNNYNKRSECRNN